MPTGGSDTSRYAVGMALGAKVRVPPPRRELLDRTRLANPLLRPDHLPRLVLIAAPPGFGKTTLLTQWLAQLTGARGHPGEPPRIAWVSLDESDTDARRFVADLVESLAAGGSASVAEALALLAAGRPVPAEQVLATVVNGLDVEGTTVIALDDFHRAAGPEVHEALAFLLENLPPQVVVAMTTRADPQLPLARMRSRGELVEVRAADLRFTTEESAGFLRAVMDLDLDQAQVEALEARTEGWVAGLQLAALSVRPRVSSPAAVDDFIRAFGGSHRFVLDYLVEEVLNAQPAGVREFLLLTSVLERMTGTLCDAVTGSSDGQQRLEQLESAQVFVTALDTERRWFRYHQLFAEALRARLSAEWPDRVAALHLAASRGYASLGLLEDALDQAALADDPEWFADLVECALPGTRKRRGDRQLLGWISVLPDDLVRRRPVLATTRAWSRLVTGEPAAAHEWLDTAEAALGRAPAGPALPLPPDLVAVRDAERGAAAANIAIYRAALAQAEGDVAQTVRQAELARAAAPAEHFVQGAAAGFIGLAAWAAGDLPRAIDTFRSAVVHLGAGGDVTDRFGATVVLAEMALSDGRVNDARDLYRDAIAAAVEDPVAAATVAADLYVGLAGVLAEQDELDAAASRFREAEAVGESASLQENRFRWHVAAAAMLRAAGDFDGALRELEAAAQRYLPGFFPELRPLGAARARVLVSAGRLAEARSWAVGTGAENGDPARYLDEYSLLTHARLVIAEHRAAPPASGPGLAAVLDVLEHVAGHPESARRRGSVVEARLVQALALAATGASGPADDALGLALREGVPAGHVRLFLDEGPAVKELLRGQVSAGRDAGTAALARRLLDRGHEPVRLRLAGPAEEPLSDRELEVLKLLASDLSGPQIAARLFVSINTLRTHTRHIFTKLGATTRRAAVSRARERHLL